MGIFDFIFGKTIKIDDFFFGEMTFMEFKKNPEKNYFECGRIFKPIENKIEIGITGDISGPTEFQKDFFSQIEKKYGKIISSVIPMIENEFRKWKEKFEIKDFQTEFKAVYLFLPRCEEEVKIWKIAFETEHDLNHIITITMSDFKATEILIDG